MINVATNYIFGRQWDFGNPFTLTIDTRNVVGSGSNANSFYLPQSSNIADSLINFLTDWGDGTFTRFNSRAQAETPHVYAVPGIYRINIYKRRGNFELRPNYENAPNERSKILKILRWGAFNNSQNCFRLCNNLDLSEVQDGFVGSGSPLTNFGNTNIVKFKNLSKVFFTGFGAPNTNEKLFENCTLFNDDFVLNIPTATIIINTFIGCTSFNGNITINAPNATSLGGFFRGCTAFNRPVHNIGFDWTKITSMSNFMTGKSAANYNASYYDALLIALDAAGQTGTIPLGMGSIKHTSAGLAAKNNLIAKGWIITDGGMN
jgi:hypothetical protein